MQQSDSVSALLVGAEVTQRCAPKSNLPFAERLRGSQHLDECMAATCTERELQEIGCTATWMASSAAEMRVSSPQTRSRVCNKRDLEVRVQSRAEHQSEAHSC